MTTEPTTPRRREGVELQQRGGIAVLFDVHDREVVHLDATAAALWELCDGDTEVEEIVQAICTVWDVHPDVARDDLEATLRMLRDAGALEWVGP